MRKYIEPEIELIKLQIADIITESIGADEWLGYGEYEEEE